MCIISQVGYMTTILGTDQKNCFDEIGNRIDCRNTLQDAEYKSRNPYFSKRFNVYNDFVEDRWTELIWHHNANLAESPLTRKEAFEFVQEVNRIRLSFRSFAKPQTGC